MKKSFPDLIIGIVLLGFLGSLMAQVPSIPSVSKGYPMFLIAVSTVMTLYLIVSSMLKLKNEDKQETQLIAQVKVIVPYCVMIAIYLFLMKKVGYIASTVAFMLASLLYLKLKNKVLMVVLCIVMPVALYFIFTNFLTVILPKGVWFNIAF